MKIALLGNPNTGKSSVFNMLTGLRQQVGNFPGVTVDKKFGVFTLNNEEHTMVDFPGTYSIYPRSKDEQVVYDVMKNEEHPDFPDLAIVVADESNLERNLFLFTQVYDLHVPVILVLNMADLAKKNGKSIDLTALATAFPAAKIVETTARVGLGKDRLIQEIQSISKEKHTDRFYTSAKICSLDDSKGQEIEATERYTLINDVLKRVQTTSTTKTEASSNKLDRILVHPVFGYLIFGAILMIIFQFIFAFAAYPMDFIDGIFADFSAWLSQELPTGLFSDLISQGIVPGIGGVLVFIPQIALLFFFIALLEESGYLARVVFIMDRIMRPLGLNGKSVVPLLSSVACAIPGVMATNDYHSCGTTYEL